MPRNIGYGQNKSSMMKKPKKMTLGIYSPPSPGDDRVKLPGLLDGQRQTAAERPFTENSAGLGSMDKMEQMKRTRKPQLGMV